MNNSICQSVKFECYPKHINIEQTLEKITADISRKQKPYPLNLNFIRAWFPEDVEEVARILLERNMRLYENVIVNKDKNNIMEYYLGYYH